MFPFRQSVVGILTAVVLAAAAACGSGTADPLPAATFGPESLQVAFQRAPDSVSISGTFSATVVARNRSRGVVSVAAPCVAGALEVRVLGPSNGVTELARPSCDGMAVGANRVPPGDSVIVSVQGTNPVYAGAYRLQAAFPATAGAAAPLVERAFVVRNILGCSTHDGQIKFSLNVAVQDAATQASLAAVVAVTDGAFTELLLPGPSGGTGVPGSYYGPEDRPGTFTVTVSVPGYSAWTREGVVVKAGSDCHVQPVGLVALLQRST